jgi:hypothetical protein
MQAWQQSLDRLLEGNDLRSGEITLLDPGGVDERSG